MRSESEIAWVRTRSWERADNLAGENEIVSQWHAIVPGMGHPERRPGVACGIELDWGTLQFTSHVGVATLDGTIHKACMTAAKRFLKTIDSEPGPFVPDEGPPEYAP